ncbi:MAG: ATP synthase F1 subunit epsilon [Chthonomonadales bacterium]|nr:ATP synthase F1 subunit epsilon [Chthonomonadales bacterium]
MATFHLELVTPDRVVFSDRVRSVRVPGIEGALGVMAGHAPLMTALAVGPVKVEFENGDIEFIATSGGFVDVGRNRVTVLTDTAERADDIDVVRVEEAIARARLALAGGGTESYERAHESLERATNRLRVVQMREHP